MEVHEAPKVAEKPKQEENPFAALSAPFEEEKKTVTQLKEIKESEKIYGFSLTAPVQAQTSLNAKKLDLNFDTDDFFDSFAQPAAPVFT